MARGAVFLDRDGIINWRIADGYVRNALEFHFLPDFFHFLLGVRQLGLLAIVVTNQQGVAKGLMTAEDVERVHEHMQQELVRHVGFGVDDIFVCSDSAESQSRRRKPEPGMLLEALQKWHLDPRNCWMVGDTITDILAGQRAGIRTILISHENVPIADFHAPNLEAALTIIAAHQTVPAPYHNLFHRNAG
ncbi:MAG: HAD family hydrolase [Candidatus Kapabacteria bacterium]|nr:HAD family hydrolase [Candidatus Kapabacteria bacterium]MCS7170211.1 HAD family hydrolase [Candidatus Kapabacteria bacterium]MDW7997657.1 HAD family hydrolase [Bacteroidota bacterium]MDW8226125.1 HAD family hydrolase [Bacteroidota bacterium]